jgi:hypothetical protein
MHFYPQGAIQTHQELNTAAGCTVFYVTGLGSSSFMEELTIHPKAVVERSKYDIDTIACVSPNSRSYFCPGDANIVKHHNKHYVFWNKADADAYLEYAKTHTAEINHGRWF